MSARTFGALVLTVSMASLLSGCAQIAQKTPRPVQSHHSHHPVQRVTLATDTMKVSKSYSLNTALLSGIRWKLSNGNHVTPDARDLKFSFSALGYGVGMFRIPRTNPPAVQYGLLKNSKTQGWTWRGIADMPSHPSFIRHYRGLALPFRKILVLSLTIPPNPGASNAISSWFIKGTTGSVVILRAPRVAISMSDYQLRGGLYVRHESSANVVAAPVGNYWIVVAGPMSNNRLGRLFRSLPLPTSSYFPWPKSS